MLNKNYRILMGGGIAGTTAMTFIDYTGTSSSQLQTSCSNIWKSVAQICSLSENSTNKYNGSFLVFGAGDTTETIDDYTLAEPIEGLTCIGISQINGTDYAIKTITSTVKNDTDESITIKEIGLFGRYNSNAIMFARKVLPTPITILSGEIYAFNYTIE